MKKYVKPELFFEQFELSTHIADCAWELVNSSDANSCAAKPDPNFNTGVDPSINVFANEGLCDAVFYCYTNGGVDGDGGGFPIFKS